MARREHEKHLQQDACGTEAFGFTDEPFGCPHCLSSAGDFDPPAPNYQPQLITILRDLVLASRILAAPEEVPKELLRSIRHAEDFLHSIDEGKDL